MTVAPKRPCPGRGGRCRNLVTSGRCDECSQQSERDRASARQRGYDSAWDRYRKYDWLPRHPLCGDRQAAADDPDSNVRSSEHSLCARDGRVVAGRVVDHIRPHRGDKALFLDRMNHQTLCDSCHNTKTNTFEGGFGNPRRRADSGVRRSRMR